VNNYNEVKPIMYCQLQSLIFLHLANTATKAMCHFDVASLLF